LATDWKPKQKKLTEVSTSPMLEVEEDPEDVQEDEEDFVDSETAKVNNEIRAKVEANLMVEASCVPQDLEGRRLSRSFRTATTVAETMTGRIALHLERLATNVKA